VESRAPHFPPEAHIQIFVPDLANHGDIVAQAYLQPGAYALVRKIMLKGLLPHITHRARIGHIMPCYGQTGPGRVKAAYRSIEASVHNYLRISFIRKRLIKTGKLNILISPFNIHVFNFIIGKCFNPLKTFYAIF